MTSLLRKGTIISLLRNSYNCLNSSSSCREHFVGSRHDYYKPNNHIYIIMIKNFNLMEGQEDLRIVEHLDMQKLPESLQQMISLASTPEEQDIILMAIIKK